MSTAACATRDQLAACLPASPACPTFASLEGGKKATYRNANHKRNRAEPRVGFEVGVGAATRHVYLHFHRLSALHCYTNCYTVVYLHCSVYWFCFDLSLPHRASPFAESPRSCNSQLCLCLSLCLCLVRLGCFVMSQSQCQVVTLYIYYIYC